MILAIVLIVVVVLVIVGVLIMSLRTVRPTSRGLVERFGKYNRFANPGIVFLVPFIEHLIRINITENMIDAGLQEIITVTA
jgi:regulator of protease activity HflC (stomatin/prohibitin superfamily)